MGPKNSNIHKDVLYFINCDGIYEPIGNIIKEITFITEDEEIVIHPKSVKGPVVDVYYEEAE